MLDKLKKILVNILLFVLEKNDEDVRLFNPIHKEDPVFDPVFSQSEIKKIKVLLKEGMTLNDVLVSYQEYIVFIIGTRDKLDGERMLDKLFFTCEEAKKYEQEHPLDDPYTYSMNWHAFRLSNMISNEYEFTTAINYIEPNKEKFWKLFECLVKGKNMEECIPISLPEFLKV